MQLEFWEITHITLQVLGIGGFAFGGSLRGSARCKEGTSVSLHMVVWVGKEYNYIM